MKNPLFSSGFVWGTPESHVELEFTSTQNQRWEGSHFLGTAVPKYSLPWEPTTFIFWGYNP